MQTGVLGAKSGGRGGWLLGVAGACRAIGGEGDRVKSITWGGERSRRDRVWVKGSCFMELDAVGREGLGWRGGKNADEWDGPAKGGL